jgi:hypothetical protein
MISLTILTGIKGRSIYKKENVRLAAMRAKGLQIEDFDEEEYRRFMEQS